ncbi:formylglycine-generating enzyme family protein [Paenibacillus spiritus]|nr:SUMF1/EgtB/PvdO family nonheme iron enzyme [Paenibacillus spiritus]
MRTRLLVLLIGLSMVISACSDGNAASSSPPGQSARPENSARPANGSDASNHSAEPGSSEVPGHSAVPDHPDSTESSARADKASGLVFIQGGAVRSTRTAEAGTRKEVASFYIGKYEVTQQEWTEVMGNNPSQFRGDRLPVEGISWYDAVEYCNKRSLKEGYTPVYRIDKSKPDPGNKNDHDPVKWKVTIKEGANGYRLPTEAEWEYAAGGGQQSRDDLYSGSGNAEDVAWYWRNAGDKPLTGDWNWPLIESNHNRTHPVGSKKPNGLGLYDMSGNVREWCWNWYENPEGDTGSLKIVKGGGWIGDVVSSEIAYRGKFEASGLGPDQGLRVARSE